MPKAVRRELNGQALTPGSLAAAVRRLNKVKLMAVAREIGCASSDPGAIIASLMSRLAPPAPHAPRAPPAPQRPPLRPRANAVDRTHREITHQYQGGSLLTRMQEALVDGIKGGKETRRRLTRLACGEAFGAAGGF